MHDAYNNYSERIVIFAITNVQSMLKQQLQQKLQQKLSPQQIQMIRLLELPTIELAAATP